MSIVSIAENSLFKKIIIITAIIVTQEFGLQIGWTLERQCHQLNVHNIFNAGASLINIVN